jgi:hypothetical protein
MNTQPLRLLKLSILLLAVGLFFGLTLTTQAASPEPACSLYYFHQGTFLETKTKASIQVVKNEFVGLLWNGTNVSTGIDGNNKTILPLGFEIVKPTRDGTYAYTFSQGNEQVVCSLSIDVIAGSLSTKSTAKSGERITLAGTAEGVKRVAVVVYPLGSTKSVYTTKSLAVKNEKYSFRMPKALKDGTYRLELQTTDRVPQLLATSTITVGKASPVALTTLVVQKIPLLAGGTVKAGSGVAVAYLQVINVGAVPAKLTGFLLGQVGSAPASVIAGVSITDELGTARGSVGNMISDTPFVGTNVSVPLSTTLAPKESRLFTVRAVVASTATANVGQTVSLALLGLTADAHIQSTLPLYGVTWTIGR